MSMQEGSAFVDYYELLGVGPTAEISEIRRAFIMKAKQHHPDAGGSTEIMQTLNKAYRTLTDTTAKAAYDMLHSFHTGTTQPSDYRYDDGREVSGITDMADDEIDSFLDSLLEEYSNESAGSGQSVLSRIKNRFRKA